jgi:tetratricopeptide (TPR) repeat protein
MAPTALDRAERLFASGRFAEVVSLLEPQVPVYRESPRFYYLLGSACLRTGDPGGSGTYLKRAEQLAPTNPELLLALAALSVRRGETEKAVEYYLRVLEERPGDRKAKSSLDVLRTEGGPEGLARLLETGRIEALYPGRKSFPKPLLVAAIVLAAAALLYLALPLGRAAFEALTRPRIARPEVAAMSLSKAEQDSPVQASGSFRYVLTDRQALEAFEKAKDYFQSYRDNAALIEINRLLGSNASPSIKEKAKGLRAFVGKPDFRTVKDAPSYAQARADPLLYDGCSVVWKGLAANVRPDASIKPDSAIKPDSSLKPAAKAAPGALAFDFLVGYQDKKRLEGLVPARIAGVEVPVDRPLEILASLRAGDGSFFLDCAAIHELTDGEP